MIERILITGSGGQGIILIGKLLAAMTVKDVRHVTFIPSYGAEVRGGTSACNVILSSKEIASPLCESFDSIIVMNQASSDHFCDHMKKDCLLFVNTSLCEVPKGPSRIVTVDATRLADNLGDVRIANFIMLGTYLASNAIVTPRRAEISIREMLAGKEPSLIELNIKAFRTGLGA